jgi:hypothetical protein
VLSFPRGQRYDPTQGASSLHATRPREDTRERDREVAALFAEKEITLDVLPHLAEADIGAGARRGLMVAIQVLGTSTRAQLPIRSRETALARMVVVGDIRGGTSQDRLALGGTPKVTARLQSIAPLNALIQRGAANSLQWRCWKNGRSTPWAGVA